MPGGEKQALSKITENTFEGGAGAAGEQPYVGGLRVADSRRLAVAADEAAVLHDVEEMAGGGGSRVDDGDAGAGYAFDYRLEERIVRAAEHDHVGPGVQQRPEAAAHDGLGLGSVEDSGLDELDKAFAGAFHDLDAFGEGVPRVVVFVGFEGAGGGEDAHDAAARAQGALLDRRLHPDEGDVVLGAKRGDGCGGGGVAGDDDDVATLFDEEISDLARPVDDVFAAFLAVGTVGVVGVIDVSFLGEDLDDLPEYGQPARSRVKNTYHVIQKYAFFQ